MPCAPLGLLDCLMKVHQASRAVCSRKGLGADNGLLYARAKHVRNPIEGAISHCTCALVGKFGSVLARQYETRQARSVHVGKKRGGFAIEGPFKYDFTGIPQMTPELR